MKVAGQIWSEKDYQGATENLTYYYDFQCNMFPQFPHNILSLKVYDTVNCILFYTNWYCRNATALQVNPKQEIPHLNKIEEPSSDPLYAPLLSFELSNDDECHK